MLSCEQEGFQALKRAQRLTSALWIKLDLLKGLQKPFIGVHTDLYGAYLYMEHRILGFSLRWLGKPEDFFQIVTNIYYHMAKNFVTAAGLTCTIT